MARTGRPQWYRPACSALENRLDGLALDASLQEEKGMNNGVILPERGEEVNFAAAAVAATARQREVRVALCGSAHADRCPAAGPRRRTA